MYVSCIIFSNGLLILRRRCEDEGERADVGVFRKDAAVHSREVRCTWLAKQTMLNNAFIVIGCGGGSCCSCGGSCNGAGSVSGSLSGGNYLL